MADKKAASSGTFTNPVFLELLRYGESRTRVVVQWLNSALWLTVRVWLFHFPSEWNEMNTLHGVNLRLPADR